MKVSLSAWSVADALFNKRSTLKNFLDFCRDNRIDNVELLDCFWTEEDTPENIKAYMQKYGMSVSSYSVGGDFVGCEEMFKNTVADIKMAVDMALLLETKNVRIFPGVAKDFIPYEEGLRLIVKGLKICAEYALEHGVVLNIENHGLYGGTSASMKEIIDAVGSQALKGNPDTGNFLLADEEPLSAFKALKGYIGFVHFKDFKKGQNTKYHSHSGQGYNGCILGDGDVPLAEIITVLKEQCYEGYISIEYEGEDIDCFEGTKKSVQFTCNLLSSR